MYRRQVPLTRHKGEPPRVACSPDVWVAAIMAGVFEMCQWASWPSGVQRSRLLVQLLCGLWLVACPLGGELGKAEVAVGGVASVGSAVDTPALE